MNRLTAANKKQNYRVFVVDDHSIVRDGLTQLINREHDLAVCGEAGYVLTALQGVSDCNPDIVTVDLSLKDGSGIRLIQNILYSNASLLILVLSMHDEFVYAERCLKAGAKGYIMKQDSSAKIIPAIKMILSGGVYVSDNLNTKLLDKFVSKDKTFHSGFERLSNRELEVYELIGHGFKKSDIAKKLNLSVKTVENNIEHIKKKMNLKDMHNVIVHAVQNVMKT